MTEKLSDLILTDKVTPMVKQYVEIKNQYPDSILFFRLGDFYEMFFEDAITASRVLDITLTKKSIGNNKKAPLCGVPYHSSESYLAKLVESGYKVAICEQMEDPATAKGIVKREVVRVLTPGTLTQDTMLQANDNNYLASVYFGDGVIGFSFCDISTGELKACEFRGSDRYEQVNNELSKIKASEVIYNSPDMDFGTYYSSKIDEEYNLDEKYKTGIYPVDMSLSNLFYYLNQTQKQFLLYLNQTEIYKTEDKMSLDKATIRNLELTETLFEKKTRGSLLGILDKTTTAMGGRKLKNWLREPLNNLDQIIERLDAVEELSDEIIIRGSLRTSLRGIYDLERLSARISYGNANAKDLIALKNSLKLLPAIKADLSSMSSKMLETINSNINKFTGVAEELESALLDDAPFVLRNGGMIKEAYSEELDALKYDIKDNQHWIASLENLERERTGIKTLKVGFNKVFGYYIDVTKANIDLVPEEYIRKQTLVNSERYITPELKEKESVVLNAETKINQLEYDLFVLLRDKLKIEIEEIQATSRALSDLDVLLSFAEVASKHGYIKPQMHGDDIIQIEEGRHPVIEDMQEGGSFVANDTYINANDTSMLLITGPNMAGKSTYMRQTALIVLMAQVGSFVPADRARIGVVDRIFTRIGASDNLAMGQSTFYVEMSELAYILNSATDKSLIILDEIGRGTSTYDGLSIAWATLEYLCKPDKRIRTMFASHYHELTAIEVKGLKNLNVNVSENGDQVIFLHKIIEGSASRSYGIHVAKLAGLPRELLDNASLRLKNLESDQAPLQEAKASGPENQQLSFLSESPVVEYRDSKLLERIKNIDLMEITPSKAISIIEDLKKEVEKNEL